MRLIKRLNLVFNIFLFAITFLAILSAQVKLLSLTEYYEIVTGDTVTGLIGLVVFAISSFILARLLIRYLAYLQQEQSSSH